MMMRGRAGREAAANSDEPRGELDCVTSGALSDEFSPTVSPGSPLDSDEVLDDLPPELLCATTAAGLVPVCLDKTSLQDTTDRPHTIAKDLNKVSRCTYCRNLPNMHLYLVYASCQYTGSRKTGLFYLLINMTKYCAVKK